MNQDNTLSEAVKMRNLLSDFGRHAQQSSTQTALLAMVTPAAPCLPTSPSDALFLALSPPAHHPSSRSLDGPTLGPTNASQADSNTLDSSASTCRRDRSVPPTLPPLAETTERTTDSSSHDSLSFSSLHAACASPRASLGACEAREAQLACADLEEHLPPGTLTLCQATPSILSPVSSHSSLSTLRRTVTGYPGAHTSEECSSAAAHDLLQDAEVVVGVSGVGGAALLAALVQLKSERQELFMAGLGETIFSGVAGAMADMSATMETSFQALYSVYASTGAKAHYGHPDVMNSLFVKTRGGLSKATKEIHVSEDVFGSYNHTLRGGTRSFSVVKKKRKKTGLYHVILQCKACDLTWQQVL